jgi:hypothetical protein
MNEKKIKKAFWIYCRSCGIEYLDEKEWVSQQGITECPACKNKLRIE